jgi:spore coat polysaccharide biosynthesis protein SpsF
MPKKNRIIAIIQARMGSDRLPGKVLLPIMGKPMLWHVVNRTNQSRLLNKVVVATTKKSKDDIITEFCRKNGISCYRGEEFDVLDRYYKAAKLYKADIVVRITSDCPLVDPALLDKTIKAYIENMKSLDGASTALKRTYPRGLDIEVFSFSA